MRWLVTLTLLLLVLAGGSWLVFGSWAESRLGLRGPDPGAASAESLKRLDPFTRADAVTRVQLGTPDRATLTLTRSDDGTWAQPGNWPLRDGEVAGLVNALTTLRTRFAVVPATNLADFGLEPNQNPVEVKLDARADGVGKSVTLRFGRPPQKPGEPEFARPTYLRVEDLPEVVKLGPEVYQLLARPAEVYRRRQLVPDADRVKLAGGDGRASLLGDRFASVAVERTGPDPVNYTLRRVGPTPEPRRDPDRPTAEPALAPNRLAEAWVVEFAGPKGSAVLRDRPDPAKLQAALTAVPELWAEAFVPADEASPTRTGLDAPDRSVTVTRADGKAITVQIGNVRRTAAKSEPAPPPPAPGMPPMPPRVTTEEYRFARLKDSDLVFELRSDKLADLFADPQDLRDPTLARFEAGEVTRVELTAKGKPPVVIARKKGNKFADKDEDKQDRWYVGDVLAESAKVTDLLDQLARLEAKGKENVLDGADPAKLKELEIDPAAGTKVTVTAQGKPADGEPDPPARTYTLLVGKPDEVKGQLPVQVAGWPRVNLVALKKPDLGTKDPTQSVVDLIGRPALAYRSRRLFDTAEVKLEAVTVSKDGAAAFAIAQKPRPAPETGTAWALTQPVQAPADEPKAGQLAGDLSRLEATEYVDDAPKPEDVEKKYGLAKPRFVVDLGFTGPGAKPRKLEVGAARDGKEEAFARLDGSGSVFAVKKDLVESLDKGALALLPLELWSTTPEKVTAVEITRPGGEAYKIAQAGGDWKLTGPFEAAAGSVVLQPLLGAASVVRAEKYDALTPDPAKHGLDQPALKVAVTFKESKPGKPGEPPQETTATKTLVVGKETAAGAATRFARLDGGPTQAVFIVPDALVKEADKPALGWLDRTLLSVDPGRVTKVQVAGAEPEANVTLTRDDKGQWKADGAAFAVDGPTADALVFTATRPPVARLAGYGDKVNWADYGLDKPASTVTITLGGDKPVSHVVKLGKAEASGERYVRVDDGQAVGVLLPRAAESLARKKLDFADKTLLRFDPTAVTAIVRKKGADELELTQSGLNWEVTKPAKQRADKPTVEDLADQLGNLRAVRVADFDPKDLGKYGLATPAAVVTLKVGADKPEDKVLTVGGPVDPAKPDGERYATTSDKAPITVGVLSAGLSKKLLGDPIKFRDKALAKFVDADKLVLERGDRKVTFAKVGGTWKVTEPVTADAEQLELDEFVNALANLRADELVAEKPDDLEPFGLDDPEAKWTVTAGRDEVVLLVGSKEEAGRVHAKLAKGEKADLVVLLDPTLTNRVLGEFRKRAVWTDLDASQVESLVVSAGSGTFQLRKDGTGWKDPAKATEPVDGGKVEEALTALAGLKAERFVADKDPKLGLYGLEKPGRVIVVTQKGGPAKTLQLGGPVGGTDGKQVYAKVPDQPAVFVLSAADTEKLTRDRAAFAGKK
jgi:hypothetical protein